MRPVGGRPGKLLTEPGIWYSVNAILDGLDPSSDLPSERMKCMVHQRRLALEAVKTKAMLLAMLDNADGASQAAKAYMSMAIPVSPEVEELKRRAVADRLKILEEFGPISAGDLKPSGHSRSKGSMASHFP